MTQRKNGHARTVLAFTACLMAGVSGAWAQSDDDPDAPASGDQRMEVVRVTGTRIPLVQPDHLPLTRLTQADLEASGATRLAEALRTLPWNNLGAQSQGFNVDPRASLGYVDLRGAGPNRTLVLINGRRMGLSPEANGEFANLNNLPLAAVQRVEVLRDGASAVYGSDAIGGVLNIVLKDRFEGWEAGFGLSDAALGADEQFLRIGGGANLGDDRLNLLWSLESTRRDPVKAVDAVLDPHDLLLRTNPTGEPGTWFATDWFGDGSLVPGPWQADPDCPQHRRVVRPPWITVHPVDKRPVGPLIQDFCALELNARSEWSPKLDADRVFLRSEWATPGHTRLFSHLLYSQLASRMQLTAGGDLPDAIGVDNPINPTWDPDAGVARSPVTVLFGLFQLGERDRRSESDYLGILLGGITTLSTGELEYGLQWDEDRHEQSVGNLALRSALRDAIARGDFNPFDSVNDPAVVESLRYTQRTRSRTTMTGLDLSWRADWPGQLPAGRSLATVAGLEWRREAYRHQADPEDVNLNVFGYLPGGIDADAERDITSAFLEFAVGPGERSLLVYSLRHDRYQHPDVSETTHKLSWSWDPLDALTLRAGWGQGFRAPSLLELFAPQVPSLAFLLIDVKRCLASGPPPPVGVPPLNECFPVAMLSYERANPDLQPERSVSRNAGLTWRPFDSLRFEADLWELEVEDQIATPTAQEILNLEAQGLLPPGSDVQRDGGGFAREVSRARLNRPRVDIRGVDLSLDGNWTWSTLSLRVYSWWSLLTRYRVQSLPGQVPQERAGGDDAPRWKSRTGVTVRWRSLSVDLVANGVDAFGDRVAIPEWWSWDLQMSWSAPWRGEATLGVRNLGDERLDRFGLRHHDYDGRTWYAHYLQRF